MPKPTPIPVRRAIYQQWQQGRQVPEIAQALGVSPRTVRHLIQRFQERGEAGISTSYSTQGGRWTPERLRVREAAEHLRREHPGWGSTLIAIRLGKQHGLGDVPTPRTIRRWLAQSDLGPAPKSREPPSESSRAEQPHEVWQMDASEDIQLENGKRVSWLRIVDEHTGAVLATHVFSRGTL